MYLAAPCHPIPHRLLRPARLVQKREQVKGSARRASRGKRGAAEVDFPPVSSHGVTRDRAFLVHFPILFTGFFLRTWVRATSA